MLLVLFFCISARAPFDSADAVDDLGFPTNQRYAHVTEQTFADMQVLNTDSGALARFHSSGVIQAEALALIQRESRWNKMLSFEWAP